MFTNLVINNKNLITNDNPSTMNLDINNKNFIVNNNMDVNIKAKKMNEYENIKSDKAIELIKSLYILKNIISFLPEKQKLKIIIYNKGLQKKLDIKIENYKRIRGIYREGDKNGNGKEYRYGELIFEGEYKNGKRNGKGKEYENFFDTYLKFEGEYLNGERNGKGKEYNDYGELILKENI